MRLIDADGIEEFASHYTEFDGIPLTEREKDLVRNVCGKISAQMPTAYDPVRVIDYLEEEARKYKNYADKNTGVLQAYNRGAAVASMDVIEKVKAGGTDEQSQTDSF